MPYVSPSSLDPEHINRVVSIQVYIRDTTDPGRLEMSSMRKYVGTLESYFIGEGRIDIKISGLPLIRTFTKTNYVELYRLG